MLFLALRPPVPPGHAALPPLPHSPRGHTPTPHPRDRPASRTPGHSHSSDGRRHWQGGVPMACRLDVGGGGARRGSASPAAPLQALTRRPGPPLLCLSLSHVELAFSATGPGSGVTENCLVYWFPPVTTPRYFLSPRVTLLGHFEDLVSRSSRFFPFLFFSHKLLPCHPSPAPPLYTFLRRHSALYIYFY